MSRKKVNFSIKCDECGKETTFRVSENQEDLIGILCKHCENIIPITFLEEGDYTTLDLAPVKNTLLNYKK